VNQKHLVRLDFLIKNKLLSMMNYVLPVRVYLEDTDAQGLVYNASYLRFFERARTEWLREHGIDHPKLRESAGVSLVLSEIKVSFRMPAQLDNVLHVSAELMKVSSVRFVFNQSARRESPDGEILCQAVAEVACVDALTGRPKRMPSGFVADLRINEPKV
jgi:acyl-CoA thioester hydrolase